ncbi:Momilactone A synthase [Acorus gramineus]|uniref:Momilactone A synthase n=1 Tax=Acorus gramineus TaxID=55184 RepID=A0AAV9AHD5_ACOGR|nr:Momilactone A synthase [Acorus gramineus]
MGSIPALSAVAKRLQGKVAVITGGASGIGEATARLFRAEGAKVVIADVQDKLGRSVSADLGGPTDCLYVRCDVTSEPDVRDAVDTAVSHFGKLDVMYNNAGMSDPLLRIAETEKSVFERVLAVNLTGAFLGTKHAARVMVPRGRGCIVATASACSVIGGTGTHAYTASKHGLVGLTKNAAAELGRFGIRVNCVSLNGVVTPLSRGALGVGEEECREMFDAMSTLKGTTLAAEDIARAVLYLTSDEGRYVSGHNLIVDGGFTSAISGPTSIVNYFDRQ